MPGRIEQGLEVMLQLDQDLFANRSAYLFCCVLDRFLGAWVEINSFTRLVASTRQQANRKEQWTWPSRAGNRTLV
jgi:type VI secretion system protein ImpG